MKRFDWVFVLAVLSAGCADRDPARASPSDPPLLAQQLPSDPDINPEDTYVVTDAEVATKTTLSFAQPITDPATGQQVSALVLSSPPDTMLHIDAGYDVNGVVRINAVGQWSTSLDTLSTRVGDTYRLLLTNGELQQFGPNGALLVRPTAAEIGDTIPPASQILAALQSDLLYGDVTAGSVDSLGGGAAAPGIGASNVVEEALPEGGRMARRYERLGHDWVLSEITFTAEHSGRQASVATTHQVRFFNTYVHHNPAADSLRARRRAAGIDIGSRAGKPADRPMLQECYEEQCFPEGGGGGVPPPPPPPPPAPPPPPPAPRNVAFQHGLGDNNAAWNRMVGWLRPKYQFGALLQPQLSSIARAQQQADELTTILQNSGQTGYVVVGHSMGGLVARRAAQQNPSLITGVLTVGTPHQGTYLALQTRETVALGIQRVAEGMYFDLGCTSANQNLPCFIAAVAYHFIPDYLAGKVDDPLNFPGTQDLKSVQRASNPFLTSLNAAAEPFTRVGIQSYPSKRWVAFRLVGDSRHNPEETWGGRFYVKVTSGVSGSLKGCFILAAFFGRWNTFRACKLGYDGLQNIDAVWNDFTAPGIGTSDGVVQGPSQVYPGSAVNYVIPGGDSHLGEPKSDRTRPLIERAFDLNFRVPRP